MGRYPSADAALRNPITGIAGYCARAASGHAAAPPHNACHADTVAGALGRLTLLAWRTSVGVSTVPESGMRHHGPAQSNGMCLLEFVVH